MKINISHIAKLANLPLTDEEKKKFEPQLEETLKYIEQLEEVDTKNVQPTNNLTSLTNIMDDDHTKESFTQEQSLANTKDKQNGYFKVKGIFSDE